MNLGILPPSFTLSTPQSLSIGQGTTTTSFVYILPQYGFAANVRLAIAGLPAGVTASFLPNPVFGSAQITLSASSTAALGTRTLTISGTSGQLVQTATLTLGVYVPAITLTSDPTAIVGRGSSTTNGPIRSPASANSHWQPPARPRSATAPSP